MATPTQPYNSYPFKLPSVERVRELFDYDPLTGLLVRAKTVRGRGSIAGSRVGTPNNCGHLVCRIDYRIFYVHRIIWLHFYGEPPPQLIDHINGVRNDNRISNLRPADFTGNSRNRGIQRNNTTGFKGVHFSKADGKFKSAIKVGGQRLHLGFFDTAEAASSAYAAASKRYHREYSREHK
jgi:hypothetical protein